MRFAFSYDWARPLLSPLGAGPHFSHIDLDDTTLRVQQGAFFRLEAPRSAITGASRSGLRTPNRGAHGWRGRWLVNGSGEGLVSITFEPAQRARLLGAPIHVRELIVSTTAPDELVSALAVG